MKRLTSDKLQDLINAIRVERDRNAVLQLTNILYRFALKCSGNPEIAREAVQSTFLKIIVADRPVSPTYVFGVLRNSIRNLHRRYRLSDNHVQLIDTMDAMSDDMDDKITAKEILAKIHELDFDKTELEIIIARHVLGLSVEEIAEQQGLTTNKTRYRLARARKRLRLALEIQEIRCQQEGEVENE